jgi:hypothetical protein
VPKNIMTVRAVPTINKAYLIKPVKKQAFSRYYFVSN